MQRTGFQLCVCVRPSKLFPRFGFESASKNRIKSEYNLPEEAFMIEQLVLRMIKKYQNLLLNVIRSSMKVKVA